MTPLVLDSPALELLVPRRIRAGEPVRFTLRVQNRTPRTLDLYLRGRRSTFDVIVVRPDGGVVWQRLQDEILPAIVHVRTLAPGETLELEAVWNQRTRDGQPIESGRFRARGLLLVEGGALDTGPVPLQIG